MDGYLPFLFICNSPIQQYIFSRTNNTCRLLIVLINLLLMIADQSSGKSWRIYHRVPSNLSRHTSKPGQMLSVRKYWSKSSHTTSNSHCLPWHAQGEITAIWRCQIHHFWAVINLLCSFSIIVFRISLLIESPIRFSASIIN